MTSFPDIKDIMLYQRYELFPLFVPIDKQLEWIEQFEPYSSPQRFLKNKVDEFDLLQPTITTEQSAILLRIYQKFLSTLATLSSHKGIILHQIKEEYDQLQTAYLQTDNQQQKFITLAHLLNQYSLEIQYDTFLSELILIELPATILMVAYQNQLCLIKRSYLEHFREEPNEKYIDPISDYCLQELMDIPIDTESILYALREKTLIPTSKNLPLNELSTKTIVYLIAEQLDSIVSPSVSESSFTETETNLKTIEPICEVVKPVIPTPIPTPAPVITATFPRHLSRLKVPMKSSLDLLRQVHTPIVSARPPLPPRKPSLIKPPVVPLKPKADPNLLKKRFK